jgi:hypothetical protein
VAQASGGALAWAGAGGEGESSGGIDCGSDMKTLVPDSSGSFQVPCLGIRGSWFTVADSLGSSGLPPGDCQRLGMHSEIDCAKPTPLSISMSTLSAPDGVCTSGVVEAVGQHDGEPDYDNQWGAGIGFYFAGNEQSYTVFDAAAAGVHGVSFYIDQRPLPGMRVEFADTATVGKGAAYWGATSSYPSSPLIVGYNQITWDRVVPPTSSIPTLDVSRLVTMTFHVPAGSVAGTYQFCIKDVSLLR